MVILFYFRCQFKIDLSDDDDIKAFWIKMHIECGNEDESMDMDGRDSVRLVTSP